MEATLMASSPSSSSSSASSSISPANPRAPSLRSSHGERLISQRVFFSTVFPFRKKLFVQGRSERGNLFIAAAKKRKEKKPFDTHSFVPKPDEATGPFPEAVLLKKKTVREDGQVLPEFADAEEEELYEFLSLQLESDLNVERMRHYEVVYLIHRDRVDEVDSVVAKVQDFVREKKGRIWRLNNWGLRRLAYKIKKTTHATYILMNFEIDAKHINDFKSMLDKDERIIRHLVMKRDKAITEDCPPPQEFHSLRAQEGRVDGDDDDGDELVLDGYDDGDGQNIVVIDDDGDDEDEDERGTRSGRTSKAEKIAM